MSNLSLKVVDIKDQPIEGAVILADPRKVEVTTTPLYTNKDGRVEVPLETGEHEIEVQIAGAFPGMSFIINMPYVKLFTIRLFYGDVK